MNAVHKYAAIDIGSNAVRLLLCNAVEEHGVTHFKKGELIRIPLRLGDDAFQYGTIRPEKADRFVKTMAAFKMLIDVFDPIDFRACATASLRESRNGDDLIKKVKSACKLNIEIISGKEEAELIYSNHIEEELDVNESYLYIDVGGGSTEVTLFDKGKIIFSQSFNIGTLRWLHGKVERSYWDELKQWVKKNTAGHTPLTAIGSGGNINKIFKMIGRKDKALPYGKLRELYDLMKAITLEDRMEIWGLNPDRADVIVPAAKIYCGIMKAAEIQEIIVPQIGLADGMVHRMHEQHLAIRIA